MRTNLLVLTVSRIYMSRIQCVNFSRSYLLFSNYTIFFDKLFAIQNAIFHQLIKKSIYLAMKK